MRAPGTEGPQPLSVTTSGLGSAATTGGKGYSRLVWPGRWARQHHTRRGLRCLRSQARDGTLQEPPSHEREGNEEQVAATGLPATAISVMADNLQVLGEDGIAQESNDLKVVRDEGKEPGDANQGSCG